MTFLLNLVDKTWEILISSRLEGCWRRAFIWCTLLWHGSDSHIITHRSTPHPHPLIDTSKPGRPTRHLVRAPSILVNNTETTYQHEAHHESHTDRPEEPCEDQEKGVFVHFSLVSSFCVREVVDDKAVARVQHLKIGWNSGNSGSVKFGCFPPEITLNMIY